uniref:Uncharacterized protein n=1 Tax=uncultured microorganism TaxID=358574 RepID=K0J3U5_9ZZZZ|nr:putative uncharacterized protein [uncultured microorganism]
MDCMFTGETADTEEHVLPKWLQARFNLWNQRIVLPNGTSLPYRQFTVPVASQHNSRFATIEQNISSRRYDINELYLWALKIHIGFIFRDASLKMNRSVLASPSILNIGNFASEIALFQQLYSLWSQGGSTDPSPFGSVFLTNSLFGNNSFDLFHCLITGALGVNLGDCFVLVFFWDQGDALSSNIKMQWDEYHSKLPGYSGGLDKPAFAYMAHHVWACESAYSSYRRRRSFNFIKTKDKIMLIPPLNRVPPKEMNQKDMKKCARVLDLCLRSTMEK